MSAAVLLRIIIVLRSCILIIMISTTASASRTCASVEAAGSSQNQKMPRQHTHSYRSNPLPSSFWIYRGGDNRRRPPPPPPPRTPSSSSSFDQQQQQRQPQQQEKENDYEDPQSDDRYLDNNYNDDRMEPWSSTSSSSSSSIHKIPNTRRPPIHYEFPESSTSQDSSFDQQPANQRQRQRKTATATFSARSDPVTFYWTRHRGRMILSAAFLGASTGTFVGHALGILALIRPLAWTFATLSVMGLFQRTSVFGELIRCLALTFIRALLSLAYIRKQYPTHIAACLGGTRHPFPPPASSLDEDGDQNTQTFPRFYAMIAAGTVGSFVLGTFPLLPTWLGALAGFATGSLSTTLPDARGDLARTVGMRGVALLRETGRLNRELLIVPKTMRFTETVWDRILFLDKQHRLKDRVGKIVAWTYTKATSAIQQVDDGEDDDVGDYENAARRPRPRPRYYPEPDSQGRNRRPPPQNQPHRTRRDDAFERF